jgi:hypothetical protein
MRRKFINVDLNDLATCFSNFHWSNLIFTIGARKERRITRTRIIIIIIIIIIIRRNGAKTISLQTLFGRLNNNYII